MKTTKLFSLAIAFTVLLSMSMSAQAQTSASLFSEGFVGDTLGDPTNWLLSYSGAPPCLTARPSSAGPLALSNGTSISNCASLDPAGQGALRLTRAANSEAGNLQYVKPLSTADGLDISFKIAIYGGNGADGLVFFLKDGTNNNNASGAAGAGLGYGMLPLGNPNRNGVPGGLLGIGFDLYGNFSSNLPNGASCSGAPGNKPSSIAIRGGDTSLNKDGSDGFCHIAYTQSGVSYSGSTRTLAQRQVRIVIDPAIFPDPKIKIYISALADGILPANPNIVIPAPAEYLAVSTFKFGFAAGTGGLNNNHEIWDLGINPVAEPAARCAGSGFVSAAKKNQDHFAFHVATNSEGTQEGQIKWERVGIYKFKGTMTRCISASGTNVAAGTGELVQRINNDWISLGVKDVAIAFTPTQLGSKRKDNDPGSISFTFSDSPISSGGLLGGGVIKIY